jgi:hypothetical protein
MIREGSESCAARDELVCGGGAAVCVGLEPSVLHSAVSRCIGREGLSTVLVVTSWSAEAVGAAV